MSPPQPDTGAAYVTNWNAFDVPAIWAMVGDYDLAPQWTHVAGWRKAFELTARYLDGMLEYRDRLVAAWPPERNQAARVYLAELDKLLASARATQEAALANHDTAAAATTALSSAKAQLSPIYERWLANATTMASYEARVQEARSGRPAPMSGPSPLPVSWRDGLNEQARAVMVGVSSELALASYRIVTPPTYTRSVVEAHRPYPEMDSQSSVVPAVIPPLVPRPVTALPLTRSTSTRPSAPPVQGAGPVLSGIRTGAAASERTPLAPSAAGTGSAPGNVGGLVGGVIGVLPVPLAPGKAGSALPGTPEVSGPPSRGGAPLTVRPSLVVEGAPQRALPPGAVIGAPVGAGLVQPAPARRVQRVNGVGETIGAKPSARAVAPSFRTADGHLVTISGSPAAFSGPTGLGRTDQVHGDTSHRVPQWDPDDPWSIEEGVRPVLLPGPEPGDHDPGPAIGRSR